MAGHIANLKPWPKGVSGNPHGPNALPAEIRAARRANRGNLIRLITEVFARPAGEPGEPKNQLEAAVLGVLARAREGEVRAFEFLVGVVCGRIPETDHESPAEAMTNEERIEALKRALSFLESQKEKESPQ